MLHWTWLNLLLFLITCLSYWLLLCSTLDSDWLIDSTTQSHHRDKPVIHVILNRPAERSFGTFNLLLTLSGTHSQNIILFFQIFGLNLHMKRCYYLIVLSHLILFSSTWTCSELGHHKSPILFQVSCLPEHCPFRLWFLKLHPKMTDGQMCKSISIGISQINVQNYNDKLTASFFLLGGILSCFVGSWGGRHGYNVGKRMYLKRRVFMMQNNNFMLP